MGISFSRAKLRPPELPQEHVSRVQLLKLLEKGQNLKLTLLIAGAGYGKSTLLAEWVRNNPLHVWYSLDAPDRDPAVFFAHFMAGLKDIWPELGADTEAILIRPVPPEPERLMLSLLGEIERAIQITRAKIIFVFDDFHRLGDSPDLNAAMKLLLERLPSKVHVVLSSRTPLNFTARLNLNEQVNTLTNHDLRFSNDEIGRILSGLDLSSEAIQRFLTQTEGWAAGLQLLRQALQQAETLNLKALPGRGGDPLNSVYSYLAEELFSRQPAALQQFLLQTAILTTFSPEECDAIFHRSDSSQWLSYLTHQNLFTIHLQRQPDIYRYHHLLSDYLQQKLIRDHETQELRDWHCQAAAYYEQKQQWVEAFEHAIQGKAEELAVEILTKAFSVMRLSGQLDTVQEWLERFSPDAFKTYPHLSSFQGFIWADYGLYDQAKGVLENGLAVSEAKKDRRGLVSVWSGFGWLNQRMGNLDRALMAWQQALSYAEISGFYQEQFTTINGLATVHGLLGQNRQTCELLHQALEKAALIGKPWEAVVMINLGVSLMYLGEFEEAMEWCNRSLDLRKSINQLAGVGNCLNTIGRLLCFTGDLQAANKNFAQARSLAEQYNAQQLLSYIISNQGDVAAAAGVFEDAEFHYRKSIQLKEPLQDALGLVHTWSRLSELYRQKKLFEEAAKSAQLAVEHSEKLGLNEQLMAKTSLVLCNLYIHGPEVTEQLSEIVDVHRNVTDNKYELTRCLWFLAYASHLADQEWQSMLSEALFLADRWNYWFLLQTLSLEVPDLLSLAVAFDLQPGLVTTLMQKLGETAVVPIRSLLESPDPAVQIRAIHQLTSLGVDGVWAPLADAARSKQVAPAVSQEAKNALTRLRKTPPLPLYATTLGQFSLRRGNQPIVDAAWGSPKAQTLFKYFLTHAGEPVHREDLLNLFWPETLDDEQARNKARGNLNQLIFSVRQALEPYLPSRIHSRYLPLENDVYTLLLPEGSEVDIQLFEEAMNSAERARKTNDIDSVLTHYERAVALYRGQYLIENKYEDWCIKRRDQLQRLALRGLYELASTYLNLQEFEAAAAHSRRLLAMEPWHEDGCALLIKALLASGKVSEARHACQTCKEQLLIEMDISESPILEELCHQLSS
ncbi:MAG: tetratricopeptide repeat protein [Anaerolineaceae bacterium]|nr:tetratricopeptide repeat protein [Anaerolineaceae bacterium]